MGFRGIFRAIVARLTTEPSDPNRSDIPYTGRTIAGPYVNAARALQNATVWACHRYLTQTIAQLPVRVMVETGATSKRVNRGPVYNLLTWRPNPELSPFQLKETLTGWAIMEGNGVAEIVRDLAGRPVALHPIEPERIDFRRDVATGDLIYRVNNGTGGAVDLGVMDVLHIRGFGNGAVGLSVVEHAAQTIGWAQATTLFGAAYFGNGLNPGGVIENAPKDPSALKRVDAQWMQRHGGPTRAHKPMYLDGGMKFVKTSATPDESQFVEAMQHQVEEICRVFGVPPQKVGHLLRMTFNNVEQLSIEVVVDSITPWAIRWEEECNFKLFGQNRMGMFVKLDLKGLLRGAFKDRQEGLQVQRRNGVINADEWRELEDMGPMTGDGGETYIVEGNMTKLALVGEHPLKPAAQPPAPAADPQPPENDPGSVADALALAEIYALDERVAA